MTFVLVIVRDLVEGILAGFGVGALLFLHRMAQSVQVEGGRPVVDEDHPDLAEGERRTRYDAALATDRDVVVYRISGAFFFGSAAAVAAVLERIAEAPKAYVVDVSEVPFLDSTAAITIAGFVRQARKHGAQVYIAGASPSLRRTLRTHGVRQPPVHFRSELREAVRAARAQAAVGSHIEDGRERPQEPAKRRGLARPAPQ